MEFFIPTVADLKMRAGFGQRRTEQVEEDKGPSFPCFLYKFCSHDELRVCPWCKTPQKVQNEARAAWAKDHPIFLKKKKAWVAEQMQRKRKEKEGLEKWKRQKVLSAHEEQTIIEKEKKEMEVVMAIKKKEEEKTMEALRAGRSERDWANMLA